jgi:hypothetical protein
VPVIIQVIDHELNVFELISNAEDGHLKSAKVRKKGGIDSGSLQNLLLRAESREEMIRWVQCLRTEVSRNPYYILLSRRKADLLGRKGKIAVRLTTLRPTRPRANRSRHRTATTPPRGGRAHGAIGCALTDARARFGFRWRLGCCACRRASHSVQSRADWLTSTRVLAAAVVPRQLTRDSNRRGL